MIDSRPRLSNNQVTCLLSGLRNSQLLLPLRPCTFPFGYFVYTHPLRLGSNILSGFAKRRLRLDTGERSFGRFNMGALYSIYRSQLADDLKKSTGLADHHFV
jgi:hypothetical protein